MLTFHVHVLFTFMSFFATFATAQTPPPSSRSEKLPARINALHDEICPIISPDGHTLYFTRYDSTWGNDERRWKFLNADIWYSELQADGSWGEPKRNGPPINDVLRNLLWSISPDGNTIMLAHSDRLSGSYDGVSFSHRKDNLWTIPQKAEIENFHNIAHQVSFSLGASGKEILMSIDDGYSLGIVDIYVSFLKNDGTWTKPLNLGPDINTNQVECTPFLAPDGVTLYFSSDGYNGHGVDIYYSRRLDSTWQHWTKPINLGPNVNTKADDYYYTISPKGDYAYFLTTLPWQDTIRGIYRIALKEKPKQLTVLTGTVYDLIAYQPIASQIICRMQADTSNMWLDSSNSLDGKYSFDLPAGNNFLIHADASGYFSLEKELKMVKDTTGIEYTMDFYLAKSKVQSSISFNDIHFKTGKAELDSLSIAELDSIVVLLKENVGLDIQILGHTDNTGPDSLNAILSLRRADAASNYLIKNRIDNSRILTKGMGKSSPVATNDTEEGRQLNRRVEFSIAKK